MTIYRVELDFGDDDVAQVHWFRALAEAHKLVAEVEAANSTDDERGEVVATLRAITVEPTADGIVRLLRSWCFFDPRYVERTKQSWCFTAESEEDA